MRVRMLHYISGGRHDGTGWPDPAVSDGIIEVPDWEGQDLIRGGNAVLVRDTELPVRAPETAGTAEDEARVTVLEPVDEAEDEEPAGQEPAAAADAAAAAAGDGGDGNAGEPGEPAAEPDEVAAGEPPEAPAPSAPKQAWIDYAVACGAERDTAAMMTKADLMSRYGGRI